MRLDDWRSLCAEMAGDAPFMWHAGTAAGASIAFSDRFADYLAGRLGSQEASLRTEMAQLAIGALRRSANYAQALQTAINQGCVAGIDELLEKHGFDILESGRVDEIGEALAAIDASGQSAGAVATAIRGYAEARLGRFDTGEAWFLLGLERASSEQLRATIALHYARELMYQLRDDAFEVLEPYADSPTLPLDMVIDVRSSIGQAYMVADRAADAALCG